MGSVAPKGPVFPMFIGKTGPFGAFTLGRYLT
jgi:hypothetical protein